MRSRGLLRTMTFMVVMAMVLAACQQGESVDVGEPGTTSPPDDTTAQTTSDDTQAPDEGEAGAGGGTLIAAQGAEPDRLDPHLTSAYASFQILENVYDTLVQPGDDLSMEPALAESSDISDDQLTWTIHLREGVTLHLRRVLVADDVVYSYERTMDSAAGAAYAFRFESIDFVTAVD